MANKPFTYKVNLQRLCIPNQEQNSFRDTLNNVPYLLYEVEQLANGDKIVVNKPGGKRNFGKLSRNDFMVFIYRPEDESLWLISHKEILEDLQAKNAQAPDTILGLVSALFWVCSGEEPNTVMEHLKPRSAIGLPCETVLKVYKWIWGQEDCNYPKGEGRWLSMNGILSQFGISEEDIEA